MFRPDTLNIHVFDVGHGDSLLIQFPGGVSHAIVDCHLRADPPANGSEPGDSGTGVPKALAHFQRLLDKGYHPVVEFVCLTHPHIDHYRGLATLMRELVSRGIPILEYWDFGVSAQVATVMARLGRTTGDRVLEKDASELEYLAKVKETCLRDPLGKKWLVGPHPGLWQKHGVSVDVIAPDHETACCYYAYHMRPSELERREFAGVYRFVTDDNSISSALLLTFGRCKVLLGGDLTNRAWERLLAGSFPHDTACDFLKISHHGSAEGNFPNSRNLWKAVKSATADRLLVVISGGYRDKLPHPDTMAAMKEAGCRIYCTGPIVKESIEPYLPANLPKGVRLHLQGAFRRRLERTLEKPRGHGDVTVVCRPDGKCRVTTQYRRRAEWFRPFWDYLMGKHRLADLSRLLGRKRD